MGTNPAVIAASLGSVVERSNPNVTAAFLHSWQVESSPGEDRIGRVRGCDCTLEPDREEEEEEEETDGVAEIDPSDVSAARVSPGSYVRRRGEERGSHPPGHAHCTRIHAGACTLKTCSLSHRHSLA